jgi:hypothetical protein
MLLSLYLARPCKGGLSGILFGSPHYRAVRPLAVRLPPDLIHWLDAHRDGEARTTFLRSILRDHIRRQSRSRSRNRPAVRDVTKESTTAPPRQPPLL